MNDQIQNLIDRGAIFYISHSAGKDSQAMFAILSAFIPADQIVVVHADLGDIEHQGVQEHITATIGDFDLNVVRAGKTFLEMVNRRFDTRPEVPSFPSSSTRQCTSDLKRDPIHKFIRQDLKARGTLLGVNCTGIRAEESASRAKKNPLVQNARLSKAGREIWEWMPIFDMTTAEVFATIADAGQEPHPVYLEGNERLSCVFCIMGSRNDIANGARLRPDLLEEIAQVETRTGWTMFQGETIHERAGLISLKAVA